MWNESIRDQACQVFRLEKPAMRLPRLRFTITWKMIAVAVLGVGTRAFPRYQLGRTTPQAGGTRSANSGEERRPSAGSAGSCWATLVASFGTQGFPLSVDRPAFPVLNRRPPSLDPIIAVLRGSSRHVRVTNQGAYQWQHPRPKVVCCVLVARRMRLRETSQLSPRTP